MEQIPKELPLSKKRGSEFLTRLQRRADYLRKRIDTNNQIGKYANLSYDEAEFSALEWTIKKIIEYEKQIDRLDRKK